MQITFESNYKKRKKAKPEKNKRQTKTNPNAKPNQTGFPPRLGRWGVIPRRFREGFDPEEAPWMGESPGNSPVLHSAFYSTICRYELGKSNEINSGSELDKWNLDQTTSLET